MSSEFFTEAALALVAIFAKFTASATLTRRTWMKSFAAEDRRADTPTQVLQCTSATNVYIKNCYYTEREKGKNLLPWEIQHC
ncbi:hypothetical protein XELAEV_18020707mg [Xenopus laevis]|uniref:Uncharacterized protein n=1 Tax=Xenopus laevis TaxID=8355 RepID=A0A974HR96_XENLA|nr:hypothetical protein XELAEV_18020707mg [Xenopus laevis]